MGESTNPRATLRFDRRVRLEFRGATITSDAGLLACRELDDALGLTETANECLQESRGGRNVQHRLVGLLRQSVYSRLAGYEDTNDAERLSDDPTMRVVVGRRGGPERPAASTNTMSRFETEVLTQDGNVEGLGRVNAAWVDRAMTHTAHRRVILDMDSSESPVHGEQEGASYNGHFGSTCYHPLFVFNQFGDCEGAMLRAGNVHSAHRWRDVLDPILSRYGATGVRRYFRADAAFAKPDIYEYLEERHVLYAVRLPGNEVLQREIAPLLIRPVGRPPKRPVIRYDDFWPGFPILGVFRLKGQPNRDNGMIFRSCKASQSPVYPIRDAILAVNHASCPSLSSSAPRQWGESALKTRRLPGALSPSWQDHGCTLPQLGAGDNRPIRSNTPWNNRRGTDTSDN